ncbi:spidroin-1-like isoform X4 [Pecten maximus]|uniref:spidroin-1-like isoform X3 n=1 Tax=Pecten maximus TaxID=6579 RepID=UPI00145853A3|nr:spidroin-1-like isoform X3 [Pecten maximus]XP_033759692.1 spidroin-1-like isoform X4 [Pecten maximus]
MEVEKIDMSLDDIIKLNRKEQRSKGRGRGQGANSATGRGRGATGRGRGANSAPGRGRGATGRGRGTQGVRGRGVLGGRGMSAGRGRAAARGNIGARGTLKKGRGSQMNFKGRGQNQFKQLKTNASGFRGRGRGQQGQKRGRGGNLTGISPLNRSISDLRQNMTGGAKQGVKQTLQQRRTKALQALQNAKETLAKIQQQQKSSRQNTVDTRRGIQTQYTSTEYRGRGRSRGRGRGTTRGRGGRGRGRVFVNQNFTSQEQYGSTTSLASQKQGRNKRRQWRPKADNSQDNILLVHVDNQKPLQRLKQQKKQPTFRQQIVNLKPSQSQSFNMQKKIFAQNSTGVSLSDRFAGGPTNFAGPSGDGRKVFF